MWEKALEIAGRVTHPWTVAAFVAVIAAAVFVFALRAKKSRLPRAVWIVLSAGIILLGFAPLLASAFLQSRGVYRIRVVVFRPDQSLVDDAQVRSSTGAELKMVEGGWELDIPSQTRPADGKVTLFASLKDEFLKGSSTLVLGQDYYPTATIQLAADTSAVVRGVVVDEGLRSVAGATVSIAGYSEAVLTDKMGNFVLPAHAAKDQMVEVRAQKGQMSGRLSAPAGKVVEVILSHE
jgi:hypothetical protein